MKTAGRNSRKFWDETSGIEYEGWQDTVVKRIVAKHPPRRKKRGLRQPKRIARITRTFSTQAEQRPPH